MAKKHTRSRDIEVSIYLISNPKPLSGYLEELLDRNSCNALPPISVIGEPPISIVDRLVGNSGKFTSISCRSWCIGPWV